MIYIKLTEFVPKNDLDKIIAEQITQHNAKKETINLKLKSSKSVNRNDEIKNEILEMNNRLKDLLVKIENNNLFVKEQILQEVLIIYLSRLIKKLITIIINC